MTETDQNDIEIRHLEDLIYRNHEKLTESLNNGSKDILDKYTECMSDHTALCMDQAFCEGFSLGVKLTAEELGK